MHAAIDSRDARFIEGVIANLDIFRAVTPQQLNGVARQSWVLKARRREVIVQRHARLSGILALAYGSVELAFTAAGQPRRVIRLVAPGETFGKAGALLGRPSAYDAVALADSKLIVMPVAAIYALMERDAQVARGMAAALARSNLRLLAELESATLQRSAQRLAAYLDTLADGAPGPCTVKLPVSKTVVAARLGVKKETLSRLLRELANQGMIAVAQRNIAILDREQLARMARLG